MLRINDEKVSSTQFKKILVEQKKIFKILAKYGGRDLVGTKNEISPGTFFLKEE